MATKIPETRKLSASTLRDLLEYKPEAGTFVGRLDRKRKGSVDKKTGYLTLTINGVKHSGHRLAWLYMTGKHSEFEIDFIDNNPSNLTWNNLREANRSEQMANSKLSKSNSSGIKGLSFSEKTNRWTASITVNGNVFTKSFKQDSKEDAITWLTNARNELHGEFANNGTNNAKKIEKPKVGYFYERNTWVKDRNKEISIDLTPKTKEVYVPEENLGIMMLKELAKLAIK